MRKRYSFGDLSRIGELPMELEYFTHRRKLLPCSKVLTSSSSEGQLTLAGTEGPASCGGKLEKIRDGARRLMVLRCRRCGAIYRLHLPQKGPGDGCTT